MTAPLTGFPKATPRTDVDEAPEVQMVEAASGEVVLDAVVRAQCLAPQVIEIITMLQNALWRTTSELARKDPQNPAVEEARLALKGALEIFTA